MYYDFRARKEEALKRIEEARALKVLCHRDPRGLRVNKTRQARETGTKKWLQKVRLKNDRIVRLVMIIRS